MAPAPSPVPPQPPEFAEQKPDSIVTWVAGEEQTVTCSAPDAQPPAQVTLARGEPGGRAIVGWGGASRSLGWSQKGGRAFSSWGAGSKEGRGGSKGVAGAGL